MIYYTADHEWIDIENGMGKVGISPHAIDQLGDVIFVELPDSGKQVAAGDAVVVFESVKAASDIYSPVSGTITEVNEAECGHRNDSSHLARIRRYPPLCASASDNRLSSNDCLS